MNGRWARQGPTAGQQLAHNSVQVVCFAAAQPARLQQLRQRPWPLYCASPSLPGHPISSSASRGNSNSSTAAQTAAVTAGTAPLLLHVLAPHAHASKGQQLDSLVQHDDQHLQLQPCDMVPQLSAAQSRKHSSSDNRAGLATRSNGSSRRAQDGSSSSSSSRNGVEPLKYQITRCIKRCTCWQEMDVLVREYGPAFNIIHISAAITHLAQLSSGKAHSQRGEQQQQQQVPGQQDTQQVQGLAAVTEQMARQHQQLQLSLAQHQQHQQRQQQQQQKQHLMQPLICQQQSELVQRLLDQAVLQLHEAESRQVANMLWSLAQLQHRSSPAVLAATMALAERASDMFDVAEGQHLANMALAAVKLQLPVSQAWLSGLQQAWLQHVQHCQQQQSSTNSSNNSSSSSQSSSIRSGSGARQTAVVSPQAAANILWALVNLQQQPSSSWLQQVVAAVAADLVHWPHKSVALFMWGCAKLGYKVPQPAAASGDIHSTSSGDIHSTSSGDIHSTSSGDIHTGDIHSTSSTLSIQQQQLQPLLQAAMQAHSRSFSYQDVSQALWGAAEMGLQVPGPLLQQLLAAGSLQLSTHEDIQQQHWQTVDSVGQQISSSVVASRQHSAVPGPATAHSVSLVLHSLARLGVLPRQVLPPLLLRPWLAALLASCPSADSHSLASAAWALCRLKLVSSCPLLVKAMLQTATATAARQQQQQVECTAECEEGSLASEGAGGAANAPTLSSRALASLLYAAAQCTADAAAAASPTAAGAIQQVDRHGRRQQQQQYLKQRQQQRLLQMLQGLHQSTVAVPAVTTALHMGSRNTAAGILHTGRQQTVQDPIASAALQLLLTTAGMQQHQQHQQQQQQLGMLSVVQPLHAVVPDASLWDMSQVLWAAGRLQLQLPGIWWQQCMLQLRGLLQQAVQQQQQQECRPDVQQQLGQSLAVAVWAVGRSGVLVPPVLVKQMQQATLPLLQQQQQQHGWCLSAQGHVMLLVGLTRMCGSAGYRFHIPKHRLQQRRWQLQHPRRSKHMQMHSRHHDASAMTSSSSTNSSSGSDSSRSQPGSTRQRQQHLKQAVTRQRAGRAAANGHVWQQRRRYPWVMRAGLQPDWLHSFCCSAAGQLSDLPPTGLVALIWALGKLRYHPGSSFLADAMQHVERLLPQFNARHIAVLLWSLERLQYLPEEALLGAVLQAWEQQLAFSNKADSQQVHWALRQLKRLQLAQIRGGAAATSSDVDGPAQQ